MTSIYCNRCGFPSATDAQFCQRCGASVGLTAGAPAATPRLIPEPYYAGFWIRVLAALIDTLFLFAALFPVRLLLGSAVTILGMNAQMPMHDLFLARRWVRIGIGISIAWAYRAGMESSRYQATLGKMAMRLKVTDLEGNRISFAEPTGRYFAKYLSALTLGIGYLMVGFDERKQGLHDRVAETLVLYRRE
ncbi:MAG TPA: RDD family protein [Candidatus Sulfotelmatobacter sp.]|jgi:uncharacterized RDD family membrane protein YckC|nr:RDD family protein [Candidatus Sulfotelmatobacter sp.]